MGLTFFIATWKSLMSMTMSRKAIKDEKRRHERKIIQNRSKSIKRRRMK